MMLAFLKQRSKKVRYPVQFAGHWIDKRVFSAMETREKLHQCVQREQQIKTRLRLATTRLHEAEQERIRAIAAASDAGLSIRQIAAATGLSRSPPINYFRIAEAREIPAWLTHLRKRDHTSDG